MEPTPPAPVAVPTDPVPLRPVEPATEPAKPAGRVIDVSAGDSTHAAAK